MRLRVKYTRSAHKERLEAIRFYRQRNVEVARAFSRDLESALELLCERPAIGAPFEHGSRRKVMTRFPYSVIYRVVGDVLEVIAVMHHRRDPESWRERLLRKS